MKILWSGTKITNESFIKKLTKEHSNKYWILWNGFSSNNNTDLVQNSPEEGKKISEFYHRKSFKKEKDVHMIKFSETLNDIIKGLDSKLHF